MMLSISIAVVLLLGPPLRAQQEPGVPVELSVEQMVQAEDLSGAEGEGHAEAPPPVPLEQALACFGDQYLEIKTPVSYRFSTDRRQVSFHADDWQVYRGGTRRLDSLGFARAVHDKAMEQRIVHDVDTARRWALTLAGGGALLVTSAAVALLRQQEEPNLETASQQGSLEDYWSLWFDQRTRRTVDYENRARRQNALVLGFGGVLLLGGAQATVSYSLQRQAWPGAYNTRRSAQDAVDAHNRALKQALGMDQAQPDDDASRPPPAPSPP